MATALALTAVLGSCAGEAERPYARHAAFFRFAPVTAVPALLSAAGNPGRWCTATYDATHYRFAAPGLPTTTYPRTALDAYGQPRSLAGFLIGTPATPELNGTHTLRAYDLCCPSCFESTHIQRALTLAEDGTDRATCTRCTRAYDLATNSALNAPSDGQTNPQLFRYHILYATTTATLVVQN